MKQLDHLMSLSIERALINKSFFSSSVSISLLVEFSTFKTFSVTALVEFCNVVDLGKAELLISVICSDKPRKKGKLIPFFIREFKKRREGGGQKKSNYHW
jgi:hypothetical protein